MIPVYISFVIGLSLNKYKTSIENEPSPVEKTRIILRSIFLFLAGFTTFFVFLRISYSEIGNFVINNQKNMQTTGSIVMILFGLLFLLFSRRKKTGIEVKPKISTNTTYMIGSVFFGMAFALIWKPYVGSIMAVILPLASTRDTLFNGILLLSSYSAGMALPFLITGIIVNKTLKFFKEAEHIFRTISLASSLLLILVGFSFLF